MATAFIGSLGLAQAQPGLLQLGGPPPTGGWSRALSQTALPFLAHLYGNDGVTANTTTATFPILNRPALKAQLTNGGFNTITLEVPAPVVGIALGNVVKLTEIGGAYKGVVYSGIVEELPNTRSSAGPQYQIVLTPFAAELSRVTSQAVYAAGVGSGVDIATIIRDALALTTHCFCDPTSVPMTTGIYMAATVGGAVDFSNQKVQQILDTVRSAAGPQWYWFCNETGRVWFQPQGSTAIYTFYSGAHYEERVSNGGSIVDRINQVAAVGGVPTGGSVNASLTVNDSASQAAIGVRALDPPIQIPSITDQASIALIANGILNTLSQNWNRVKLKALPPTGQAHEVHPGRVHGSQPGGAMMRYFEPTKNPQSESAVGAGYSSTYITQTWEYDGLNQLVEAGNIPITSQTDIDNMVKTWANRAAGESLKVTAAALNLQQQVLTGTYQSAATPPAGPNALWALSQTEFAAIDSNGVTRAEMGNLGANGISPAQWGFRANDATGAALFDSLGVVGVMSVLGDVLNQNSLTETSTSPVVIPGMTVTFTLTRSVRILVIAISIAKISVGTVFARGGVFLDGVAQPFGGLWDAGVAGYVNGATILSSQMGAGSHTIDYRVNVDSGATWLNFETHMQVFQLGG